MTGTDLFMGASAVLSPCGTYRYWLTRRWSGGARYVVWIMLNPSTADASIDDPTIRKCIGFSQRWGFDALEVVNLFAYRATDPGELEKLHVVDPVGPDNHEYVKRAVCQRWMRDDFSGYEGPLVVCAWGNGGSFMDQGATVRGWLEGWGATPQHLGLSGAAQPKHPLYLPYNTPLQVFP